MPVCREVFDEFENVYMISNDSYTSIQRYLDMPSKCLKNRRYFRDKTVKKEFDLINMICLGKDNL